jgi:ribosomal protein S8
MVLNENILLSKLKNSIKNKKRKFTVNFSYANFLSLEFFLSEKLIESFYLKRAGVSSFFVVFLKYDTFLENSLESLVNVSKLSRKIYFSKQLSIKSKTNFLINRYSKNKSFISRIR